MVDSCLTLNFILWIHKHLFIIQLDPTAQRCLPKLGLIHKWFDILYVELNSPEQRRMEKNNRRAWPLAGMGGRNSPMVKKMKDSTTKLSSQQSVHIGDNIIIFSYLLAHLWEGNGTWALGTTSHWYTNTRPIL